MTNSKLHGDMLDITDAKDVKILIRGDEKVLWINIGGQCRVRICRIEGGVEVNRL